ncbi:hypothetical protein TNCV_4153471 [Trichonephila clavipes]|nr:hypothetical protein TNCV_4153471 [Trichonephila clavipes]
MNLGDFLQNFPLSAKTSEFLQWDNSFFLSYAKEAFKTQAFFPKFHILTGGHVKIRRLRNEFSFPPSSKTAAKAKRHYLNTEVLEEWVPVLPYHGLPSDWVFQKAEHVSLTVRR